jgi:hypothetical protein
MYPEPDEATPNMYVRMFERYVGQAPSSMLDMGCGTARDLNVLSSSIWIMSPRFFPAVAFKSFGNARSNRRTSTPPLRLSTASIGARSS